ncbi:isochorismatase family protein [Sinomonas susongensis]|uniref:isochorismatase family protein n=1 Tax=Sinomonas susongensis TaxID=1324851 RepID=UPI001108CC31|nr:isochorismatase family protein [Sinomonas susongensis]
MTISTLDAQTALVVIDLQNGIVNSPQPPADGASAPQTADVVSRSKALAAAFRAQGLPVVLVNVAGSPAGRNETPRRLPADIPAEFFALVDGLAESEDDILVTKRSLGAFATTDLHDRLRERGVTQLVFTGISTSVGVESSARHAYDLGYNVAFAVDAMTDRSAAAHENSVSTVFPRLGESGTTEEILGLLADRK